MALVSCPTLIGLLPLLQVMLIHTSASFSLKADLSFSPPDPQLSTIQIAGGDLQGQSVPIGYAATWPVWMVAPDGSSVTRIPDASLDDGQGWVNPITFEQLWLPIDLPPPTSTMALGLVLKDGVPRYLFPTLETILATSDGGAWHNRGLNSLAIGKTWLPFNDVAPDNLRLSCHKQNLPGAARRDEQDGSETKNEKPIWKEVLELTEIANALNLLFKVLSKAPDELGTGFNFLIAPVPAPKDAQTTLDSVIIPGQRVRCFLSNADIVPESIDPDEKDSLWTKTRGECELTVYNVAPGGDSAYLPDAYKQLYDKSQCS